MQIELISLRWLWYKDLLPISCLCIFPQSSTTYLKCNRIWINAVAKYTWIWHPIDSVCWCVYIFTDELVSEIGTTDKTKLTATTYIEHTRFELWIFRLVCLVFNYQMFSRHGIWITSHARNSALNKQWSPFRSTSSVCSSFLFYLRFLPLQHCLVLRVHYSHKKEQQPADHQSSNLPGVCVISLLCSFNCVIVCIILPSYGSWRGL